LRFVADGSIDARAKTGTAPDEYSELRLKSAHQSLITDVFRLRPHPCTFSAAQNSNDNVRRQKFLPKSLDEGHQSALRLLTMSPTPGMAQCASLIAPYGLRA
jgi:hypothetical protein